MKKKWKQKLRQQNGETLIESLVSLVIIVLAIGVLSSCVIASTKIIAKNKEADKKYYEQMKTVNGYQGTTATEEVVKITFDQSAKINGVKDVTFSAVGLEDGLNMEVDVYGTDGDFASYIYKPETDTP